MAETARQAESGAAVSEAPGLLDQIITNTKQTEPDRAQDLVKISSSRRSPVRSLSTVT